jgi:hypothetical protein
LEKTPRARPETALSFWQELASGLTDLNTVPEDTGTFDISEATKPSLWQKVRGWFGGSGS